MKLAGRQGAADALLLAAMGGMLLAACGGGDGGGAAVTASAGKKEAQAAAAGWVDVARQGESFTLGAGAVVRYGAGDRWLEKRVAAGSWHCGDALFGTDFLPRLAKTCQVDAAAVQPDAPPNPLPAISFGSPLGGQAVPFTVAQAFRQGDVPAGVSLVADTARFQAVVKNRWPDGSVKLAILSGRVDLAANAWKPVQLKAGAAAAAPPLTTAQLKASGASVSVQFAPFGTAAWSGADWDAPAQEWVSGAEMSSWTYRKPLGGDAHLVAWLEVRAYAGGAVEVLPWIENGYLRVAAPTAKAGTATLVVNGTTRFSQALTLLNHQRAVLASGTQLTHWTGTDPQTMPRLDTAYLTATRLVPNYRATVPSNSPLYGRLPAAYEPLGQADYPSAMGSTGYHPSIGLLPEWDAAYLATGGDPRAWRGVVIGAYAAGRYGLHFRDEATQRPIRFSSHPTLVLGGGSGITGVGASTTNTYTPPATGGAPPTYASSHHPSMGYLAYLLTGWHYFIEESQYLATANFLKQTDSGRQGAKGILLSSAGSNTTRGAAWAMRSLLQAATITPDGDALRDEFVDSIGANIAWYHHTYVATPNNPLGLVQPYSNYNGAADPYTSAVWMDDFFTAAFGYLKDTQSFPPASARLLDEFLQWKYKSVVGRLGGGGEGEYSYRHGAQYTLPYAPTAAADWKGGTGPWYPTWGHVARAMGLPTVADAGQPLESGYPDSPTGYWANLMPAISYAVDHQAPGAAQAWNRIVTASNFAVQAASYGHQPVWGVKPRGVADGTLGTVPTTQPPSTTPTTPPHPTTPTAPPADPRPPSAPATAAVTLRWAASGEADLAGYRVYYGTSPGAYLQRRGAGIEAGLSPSFLVTGLPTGANYYFAVTAYDLSGNESGYSAEASKALASSSRPSSNAVLSIQASTEGK